MNDEIVNINNEEDDEIDLGRLFAEIRRRWVVILIALLVGGLAAGIISKFIMTPQYTSKAVVFILTKETTLTSLADLQIGSQLTNDYKVVVTSRTVLEDTIADLGIEELYTYKQLKDNITVENPQNTRILEISATVPSPVLAKMIVDAIANNAAEYIADTMEITPPKIIESGEVPTAPSKPSVVKNTLIGALIGLLVAVAYVVIMYLLNDSVKTADDVEKYLGLTVLGTLPDRAAKELQDDSDKSKGRRRTKHRKSAVRNGRSRNGINRVNKTE